MRNQPYVYFEYVTRESSLNHVSEMGITGTTDDMLEFYKCLQMTEMAAIDYIGYFRRWDYRKLQEVMEIKKLLHLLDTYKNIVSFLKRFPLVYKDSLSLMTKTTKNGEMFHISFSYLDSSYKSLDNLQDFYEPMLNQNEMEELYIALKDCFDHFKPGPEDLLLVDTAVIYEMEEKYAINLMKIFDNHDIYMVKQHTLAYGEEMIRTSLRNEDDLEYHETARDRTYIVDLFSEADKPFTIDQKNNSVVCSDIYGVIHNNLVYYCRKRNAWIIHKSYANMGVTKENIHIHTEKIDLLWNSKTEFEQHPFNKGWSNRPLIQIEVFENDIDMATTSVESFSFREKYVSTIDICDQLTTKLRSRYGQSSKISEIKVTVYGRMVPSKLDDRFQVKDRMRFGRPIKINRVNKKKIPRKNWQVGHEEWKEKHRYEENGQVRNLLNRKRELYISHVFTLVINPKEWKD